MVGREPKSMKDGVSLTHIDNNKKKKKRAVMEIVRNPSTQRSKVSVSQGKP